VTRFRLLDRVHGERSDGIRHAVVLGAALRQVSGFAHCGGRWRHQVCPQIPGVDST
jgi:hypothetical protein